MNTGLTTDTDSPRAQGRVSPRFQVDHIIAVAHFPVYGLLGHPDGLTLQSIGYCGDLDLQRIPTRLTQVSLDFAYPPASHRSRHRLEVITTDPTPPPYLTLSSPKATMPAHVIEHFQLADRTVPLLLRPEQGKLPTWSFIIATDDLRVDGRAVGWTQAALLDLLQHAGAVHAGSQDVASYAVEQEAWTRYYYRGLDRPR